MRRRVVVTGLGMVTPLGAEVKENWEKALAGASGIKRLQYPDAEKSPVKVVGQVSREDKEKIAQALGDDYAHEAEDRTRFALWAAMKAFEDAGLKYSGQYRRRFGVSLASGIGTTRPEDVARWASKDGSFDYKRFAQELDMLQPDSIMLNPTHRAPGLIARRLGLGGENRSTTTACAATTQALGLAYRSIQRGTADVMLAGGCDSMINPIGLVFFVLVNAASGSDDPSDACRPFDRKRSGLVMGEGAGVAVLEELEHARNRGANIYAEVAGYGASMDAYQVTAPHPEGKGAVTAMSEAMKDAGMGPGDIDHINAHGTSTKLNDPTETLAIKKVFGEHAPGISINSSKSLLGHLLAGSGGPEFAFAVLSVLNDVVHPTAGLENPDPKCDLDYTPGKKRKRTVRAALSNSFGFGGQNAAIIVKKYGGQDK